MKERQLPKKKSVEDQLEESEDEESEDAHSEKDETDELDFEVTTKVSPEYLLRMYLMWLT